MATSARSAVRRAHPKAERIFFTAMGLAVLLAVLIGFAPSYYLRGILPPRVLLLPMTPLVHLHGLLFSAWVALFVAQTWLVAANRRDLHMRLGKVAFALVPAMLVLGMVIAVHGMLRAAGPPVLPPAVFLSVPLFDMPVFATLVGVALIKRRDLATHKRLMLIATLGMLAPALGRIMLPPVLGMPYDLFSHGDLFLLPLIVWDLVTLRRIHAATLWGGLFLIGSQVLRLAVAQTPAWLDFAHWLAGIYGG